MIKGMHALFYTPDAAAARAFFRDVLGLPYTDTGDGWLIFEAPEADIGFHPASETRHEVSFYCDDLDATIAELKAKGVEFIAPVDEQEWGFITRFRIPGDLEVELYQPKYQKVRA
jgi:catechol 2,3-dioxygenase-like lactoylglutathione lyase family enzyme